MGIFAAAALTATMIVGNVPAVTEPVNAAESQENVADSLIPDNITIDQPTELANVALPATENGILEWADGSYVPTQRVQACEVLLIPAEGQDLSHADGWDSETGAVIGYINVVVTGIDDSDTADKIENSEDTETPSETPSETPAADEKDAAENKDGEDSRENKSNIDEGTKENKKEENKENIDDKDKEDNKNSSSDADESDKTSDSIDVVGKLEPADDAEQDTTDDIADDTNKDSDSENDNIFDNPVLPDEKDDRPTDAEENLTDAEKEERAEINHTYDGITVSGVNLPWYVQFRVSSGDSYQFTNESDAMIFQSYEFELWDLQNNTEYEIPSGEYVSVTVPVKSGYQYTIEHLLDNGATETIIPSVENDIMVFSTHSFSPFGIAGSRQLVGPDTGDGADSTQTVTPTPTASSSQGQSSNTNNSNTASINDSSDSNNGSSSSVQTDSSAENETAKNSNAVNTGDTTTIMPFVILVVAAAVIIGAVVFIKKKKK